MHNRHTVSDVNPTFVTGAEWYRISATMILAPELPGFAELEETVLFPEHRRPQGYGIAFLESEEHSVTYVGTIGQIEDFRAANVAGAGSLDVSLGRSYAFWPQGGGWDEILPCTFWNPGGQGIVTEFDHRATSVVVYEYLEDREGEQVAMVGFHCLHCHNDDWDDREENRGPQSRRWIAAEARKHLRVPGECRPVDPRIAEMVTAVANREFGTNRPVITHEARCAATGPCAQIRGLRVTAAATADAEPEAAGVETSARSRVGA